MASERQVEPDIELIKRLEDMATLDASGVLVNVLVLLRERAEYAQLLLDPEKIYDVESIIETLDEYQVKLKNLLILE